MESWNSRFQNLEINHLRSPCFAHPVAFEPTDLLNFAVSQGRTRELIDAPFVNKLLSSGDAMAQQDELLRALPSTSLFRDFCASLENRLPHRWLSGKASAVCKDVDTGKFHVHFTSSNGREHKVVAHAVILATGPVGTWRVPAAFKPHISSPLVLHTEALLAKGHGTLREEITRRCPGESARVLVIGGGISAAQAALAAFHAGHQVVLRSRRPLHTRDYDLESKWLDARNAERLRFDFLSLTVEERLAALREATPGGSVPSRYMKDLIKFSQASSALKLEVDVGVDESRVRVDDAVEHIVVNGESFAMVILATGVVTNSAASPLYRSVEQLFENPTIEGFPPVDSSLRWTPDENLFVLGANALLELGPGGGNLMGAMRGARIVANELHSLMWQRPTNHKAEPIFANKYASLFGGSEDEGESISSSDEDGDRDDDSAARVSEAPTASPQCKSFSKKTPMTKQEVASQKARKHRRATKPKRGSMR